MPIGIDFRQQRQPTRNVNLWRIRRRRSVRRRPMMRRSKATSPTATAAMVGRTMMGRSVVGRTMMRRTVMGRSMRRRSTAAAAAKLVATRGAPLVVTTVPAFLHGTITICVGNKHNKKSVRFMVTAINQ
jgi:hypothetical protein